MTDLIARLFEPLLRFWLPATGRHRDRPTCPSAGRAPLPAYVVIDVDVLRGDDNALVRPYLVADELRLRRQRRRALWLAVHGLDVGSRVIHGMKVA